MSVKKVKSASKMYVSDRAKIKRIVTNVMSKISDIVGGTLGPSGRVCLIESEYYAIPNKNTKDGVTVFNALGAEDPLEQLIIEQTRDAAKRTASEAGDGTTTATILSAAITTRLLEYCDHDPKFSPQKIVRIMNKALNNTIVPMIKESSIHIGIENKDLLYKVAKVSANGDDEIAKVVVDAFDIVGYGDSSHMTIQELSGPGGYEAQLIDGYPIPMGFESIGKFHTAFINDQANLRCALDNPVFLLYDGMVSDLIKFEELFMTIGRAYENNESDVKNVVFVAHGFGEAALNQLALNFVNPSTINVFPLVTPMNSVANSKENFLMDLSAFTGAKIFGMRDSISNATPTDLGSMERFECYRFRSTVVGDSDELNIQVRAEALKKQLENPASEYDARDLKERLGKLTNGIAMIKVFGGSSGDLKERHDRVEDAVCAVRAAIAHGALPGGCRVLMNVAMTINSMEGTDQEKVVYKHILAPALMTPIERLLDNAGYNLEEKKEIMSKMIQDKDLCYDVENQIFGKAEDLGLFDASKAVEEAVKNAMSIASVMGVTGGLICFPRDHQLERQEASADIEHRRVLENPEAYVNEANERH